MQYNPYQTGMPMPQTGAPNMQGMPTQQTGYNQYPQQQQYGTQQTYGSQQPFTQQPSYGTQQPQYGPQQTGYTNTSQNLYSQPQMGSTTPYTGVKPQMQPIYHQFTPSQDPQLYNWFKNVDRDNSGHIDALELRTALSDAGFVFDDEVAKKLIRMFDRDGNGYIDFSEFGSLHTYLTHMKTAFYSIDLDRNNRLDYNETERALISGGYKVERNVLYKLFKMFDGQRRNFLTFDSYIKLCIFLGTCKQIFTFSDKIGAGTCTFNFDSLVDNCMLFLQYDTTPVSYS